MAEKTGAVGLVTLAPQTDSPVRGGPSFDLDLIRAQQEKLRHTAKLHWTHWLIISLSLLITVFAWKTSESALVKRDQIRFDREAERSVNLMENAIKYNPNKDTATLSVSVIEEHGVHRFRVSDNGPGIARRFHKRIFQPFTTLESITDIHSSGIGLSIVQRAVERQGGQIDVISQENAGTTFEFTWPISDEQSNNHRGKRYA